MFNKPDYLTYINPDETRRRRKRQRWTPLWLALFLIALCVVMLVFVFSSCSVEDDRDVCCDNVEIRIRYVRETSLGDRYRDYIKATEHFIFDASGTLLSITTPTGAPEELRLKPQLPYGKYTLLVVGNRSEKTPLPRVVGQTNLADMLMTIQTKQPDGFYANGDRLYWGLLPFEAIQNKPTRYICDVSNIHCRLRVTVKWTRNLPAETGEYTLQLRRVPQTYRLRLHEKTPKIVMNPFPDAKEPLFGSTQTQVVHSFPYIVDDEGITHRLFRPMSSAKLDGEFITMRYDDHFIPLFRVFKGDKALMKEIDLTRFFREMKWIPTQIPEQVFHIIVEIDPVTGSVTVTAAGDLGVLDWQDGGSIGKEV